MYYVIYVLKLKKESIFKSLFSQNTKYKYLHFSLSFFFGGGGKKNQQ